MPSGRGDPFLASGPFAPAGRGKRAKKVMCYLLMFYHTLTITPTLHLFKHHAYCDCQPVNPKDWVANSHPLSIENTATNTSNSHEPEASVATARLEPSATLGSAELQPSCGDPAGPSLEPVKSWLALAEP
jgi:hypothetical protein